jgi:hypothetical protein
MAATAAASRLTEAHRLAQIRLGVTTVQQMLAAWPLLDVDDLDGTSPRWVAINRALIGAQHRQSVTLAADYLRTFRALELGSIERITPVLGTLDPVAVTTSLIVTGPVRVKNAAAKGLDLAAAMERAAASSAAAGMRHALAGGRDTIDETVKADPKAIGWARVTSGKACEFCSMLADRGAVYGDDTAHFDAHDGCSCTAEPAYA